MSLQGVCLSSWCFLSGRFCPGWFLSVPLLSEYIRYNRKLNITVNFRFHMYTTKFQKCDVTCSWTPPLCHKLSHLLGPPRARRTLWTAPFRWVLSGSLSGRFYPGWFLNQGRQSWVITIDRRRPVNFGRRVGGALPVQKYRWRHKIFVQSHRSEIAWK